MPSKESSSSAAQEQPTRQPRNEPSQPTGSAMICLDWWDNLTGATDTKSRDSAQVAQLRRAKTVLEASLCPAYHHLIRRMPWLDVEVYADRMRLERLAVVASVLSHVRHHLSDHPVSKLMGRPPAGKTTSLVSELRFRRLMQVRTNDDLIPALRRTVDLLDKRVDVADLSNLIIWWGSPEKMKDIAFGYYSVAPD